MVRERVLGFVLVAALAPAAAGVASAANKEHLQMMAEIRILQEQTALLRAQLISLNETLRALGTRLDEQAGVARKAMADQKLSIDTIGDDLRVLREKVDDNNVRVSSLAQELEAIRTAVAQAATQPAAPAGADSANPAGAPAQPAAGPPSGVPVQSPQRLFDTPWADYMAGQFNLAISGFENYVRTFPRSEQAGEAQYLIGECYYQHGMFKEAVTAYDRGITTYPNSQKVPDMYFKRGMAFNALGLVDRARESWEYVVKTFPNSDAGRLARQRLDQIIRKDASSDPESDD